VLVPEDRHVREHRQREDRRRRRLRRENVRIADPHPRLFAERRVQIGDGSLEDPPRRAAQSRIVFVSALGERSGSRLAEYSAGPTDEIIIARLWSRART